jgi:hypothetical protein
MLEALFVFTWTLLLNQAPTCKQVIKSKLSEMLIQQQH